MAKKELKGKTIAVVLGVIILIAGALRLKQLFFPPTPEPEVKPIVTTQQEAGKFVSNNYHLTFDYPSTWQEDPNSIFNNEVTRVYGADGYAAVDAIGAPGQTIDQAVKSLTEQVLLPYGSNPIVTSEGMEARFILPSSDQPSSQHGEAAVVLAYPRPIRIDSQEYQFAVIYADKRHILEIGRSVTFVKLVAENEQQVNIFMMNNNLDPQITCALAFPVLRTIKIQPSDEETMRAILAELLKGPTESEIAAGYFTSINPGVPVPTLRIGTGDWEGGVGLDFDQKLQDGVAGSCRVTSIRTQITETVKQNFPWVKEVLIAVDGNVDEALQP